MFLFGIFCRQVLALNQIAVEFRETPLTRTGENQKNVSETMFHKGRSFVVEKDEVKVLSKITPNNPYGFHMYLEDEFKLKELPFITENNKNLFISSLESPIDDLSLASLYFQSILPKKESEYSNVYLNVSCKDYFNKNQTIKLASIFSQLGFVTRTIPESMAACIFNCKSIENNGVRYQYFLNLNGSKSVSSLYKIEKTDKGVSISLEKMEIEKEIPASYEIEHEIFKFMKSAISCDEDIAFLPYEKLDNKSKYVDFKPFVSEFIQKYNSGLSEYVILEIGVYDIKSNQRERPIIETTIKIKNFLPTIDGKKWSSSMIDEKRWLSSVKENKDSSNVKENKDSSDEIQYESFLISAIRPPMSSSEIKIVDQRIIEGLFLSHDTKYELKDSRIEQRTPKKSEIFESILSELEIKHEVLKKILPNIDTKLADLKNLTTEEKQSLEDLVKNINFEKLSDLKSVKSGFEQLIKLDVRKYIEITEKPKVLKSFLDLFAEADALCSQLDQLPEDKVKFSDFLAKTRQWFDENSSSSEIEALNKQLRWLQAYFKVTGDKLKKFNDDQKKFDDQMRQDDQMKPDENCSNDDQKKQDEMRQDDDQMMQDGDQMMHDEKNPTEETSSDKKNVL